LYRRRVGAYPPSVDALVNGTMNIHFLRKQYTDPTTGEPEWKPVIFGQNQAPLAMGYFGVQLGAPVIAGNGAGGSTNGMQTAASLASQSSGADPNAPADPNNNSGNNSGSNSGTSAFGQSGKTFGGAGIIGFSPKSTKQSIMIYKTKSHYNEWEFVYTPLNDMMMQQFVNPVESPPLQPGAPGFSSNGSTPTNTNTLSPTMTQ
jgi:hypothetical protein